MLSVSLSGVNRTEKTHSVSQPPSGTCGSVVTTPVVTWRRKERTEGQPGKRQFLGKEHKGEGAAGAAVEWAEAEEIDL